jgi:hypothetical protein
MGTRCDTIIYDVNIPIVRIFRMYDGHPDCHGVILARYLEPFVIYNGYTMDRPEYCANGAGCLAAQLVQHLKDGIGNIYIEQYCEPDEGECIRYEIVVINKKIIFKLMYGGEYDFIGSCTEFIEYYIKRNEGILIKND